MSTSLAGLSTNFFPKPQNGFTTTTAGSVASGAATVTLNSVAGYSNGDIATLVIDPTDASKKQTFTGVVDTAGVQLTSVKWTAGTNQTHALGATVVDYATATHIGQMSKGILIEHNQSGNHTAITGTSAVFTGNVTAANFVQSGGAAANGWTTGLTVPNTVTALGNRSYSLVVNSTDLTGTVSAGMRLRTTRTVAAPTQCTSLNGTNQYYSKTTPAGMTFTNNFVVSAWVKVSSYAQGIIASRYNGTSGWDFRMQATGQLMLVGYNAGASNISYVLSYQSLPLNKWVHVTAQLDMSAFTATTTTSYTMLDGLDVPAQVLRGGTNPTALIQAGNLEIGGENGGTSPFPGKIAQVAIYSAKVTQATILASMHQGLAGTETSLISAYSFNNTINDLNANANNLTANGSAVATNTDSPFGGQADGTISSTLDYAIITKTAFSTNTTLTVQVPEGCTIPTSGGVSALSYSTQALPYLFPRQREKWRISCKYIASTNQGSAVDGTWYNLGSQQLAVPIGEWDLIYQSSPLITASTNTIQYQTLSTANNTESDTDFTTEMIYSAAQTGMGMPRFRRKGVSVAASTPYYLNTKQRAGTSVTIYNVDTPAASPPSLVEAECSYL